MMMNLKEAAAYLGYSPGGLRKIVDRSRRKTSRGPKIKFFQTGPWGPILFRKAWLEEFIEAHTVDPTPAPYPLPKPRKKKWPPTECTFGFDPSLCLDQ